MKYLLLMLALIGLAFIGAAIYLLVSDCLYVAAALAAMVGVSNLFGARFLALRARR
ncbi:MAG: hypothetical protein NC336_04015 [Clostridium sp.]|nr:hypothetical protein [Clostridium sp.]